MTNMNAEKILDKYLNKYPWLYWSKTNAINAMEEYAKLYHESEVNKLKQADVISCVCPNEIKTGTVAIHCCNICGKPDEGWWGKH